MRAECSLAGLTMCHVATKIRPLGRFAFGKMPRAEGRAARGRPGNVWQVIVPSFLRARNKLEGDRNMGTWEAFLPYFSFMHVTVMQMFLPYVMCNFELPESLVKPA